MKLKLIDFTCWYPSLTFWVNSHVYFRTAWEWQAWYMICCSQLFFILDSLKILCKLSLQLVICVTHYKKVNCFIVHIYYLTVNCLETSVLQRLVMLSWCIWSCYCYKVIRYEWTCSFTKSVYLDFVITTILVEVNKTKTFLFQLWNNVMCLDLSRSLMIINRSFTTKHF